MTNPFLLLTVFAVLCPALANPAPILRRHPVLKRDGLHDCGVFIQRVSTPPSCPSHPPLPPHHAPRAATRKLTPPVVGLLLRHLHLQLVRHFHCLPKLGLHPNGGIRRPNTPRRTPGNHDGFASVGDH